MDQKQMLHLLQQVRNSEVTPQQALLHLRKAPFEDLGYAKNDCHRGIRQGTPEVIYGAGKTPEQIDGIVASKKNQGETTVMVTRMAPEAADLLQSRHDLEYHAVPGIGIVGPRPALTGQGTIVVATGGTIDMPVAEEAAITAEVLGNRVTRLYDVGVAGIHRLFAHLEVLMRARTIIAIAGMEGALASVIGGLVDCPVIGVPTSVGYGSSFHGLSALLTMLNSCASGVCVVNIDNGFGAGYLASMINHEAGARE